MMMGFPTVPSPTLGHARDFPLIPPECVARRMPPIFAVFFSVRLFPFCVVPAAIPVFAEGSGPGR